MIEQAAAFPGIEHDHRDCVRGALRDAGRLCAEKGLRLTSTRRRVLELIWQSHCPSRAYEILDQLTREDHTPSPPTVYRALGFLLGSGLIHRINSRNAIVGCAHPRKHHDAQIFIYDRCSVAVEQADNSVNRRIQRNAAGLQFRIREQPVEISGLCPRCAEHSDDT